MLSRENWPTTAQILTHLKGHFSLPAFPAAFQAWQDFMASAQGMGVHLDEQVLDGRCATDTDSAILALEGYRFVIDQKLSTPADLVCYDLANGAPGNWQPSWIVLDSIEADPIIADLSQPHIPILLAAHGAGEWRPTPLFDSMAALIEHLRIAPKFVLPSYPPSPLYTVCLTELGPDAKHVLLALKNLPQFSSLSPAALLALKKALPLALVENNGSEIHCKRIADFFTAKGARVEILSTQQV